MKRISVRGPTVLLHNLDRSPTEDPKAAVLPPTMVPTIVYTLEERYEIVD